MKAKALTIFTIIALCISMVVVITSPVMQPVQATTTWYVNPGESIQDAVDAASPWDTIIVMDGTYTENVDINKYLTLQSENGAALTTVQAANTSDDVFMVTADFVNITGFTATGATGVGYHGIYLEGAIFCTLTNNIVVNNWGGILLNNSNRSDIANNNVNSNANGGGIVLEYSLDNHITSNTANLNGNWGIRLYHADNNDITQNEALNNGAYGIQLYDADFNDVISNDASDSAIGIGLYFLIKCSLVNNNASNNGHGILLSGVTDSEIMNNNTSGNTYGIWVSSNSDNNDIYLNNFINNTDNYFISMSINTWNSPGTMNYTYNSNSYTSYLGNYWSDYTGTDTDSNGIGDTPYSIYGDNDNYPLMEPVENYTITHTLTINSTCVMSYVGEPGVGTFTYPRGTEVSLKVGTIYGCEMWGFTGWTGDVDTMADIYALSTTITMYGNYSITATCPPVIIVISNLYCQIVNDHTVRLFWYLPYSSTCGFYLPCEDIRYSTSPITEENWDNAIQCTGKPILYSTYPYRFSLDVDRLTSGTTYYFRLKPTGQPLSNETSCTTPISTPSPTPTPTPSPTPMPTLTLTPTPTPTPTPISISTIHIDSNPFLVVYPGPDCSLPEALTNIEGDDCTAVTIWGVEDIDDDSVNEWISYDANTGAGYLGSYGLHDGQAYIITHEDCICTNWEMCQ